jgi:hypothetical protein
MVQPVFHLYRTPDKQQAKTYIHYPLACLSQGRKWIHRLKQYLLLLCLTSYYPVSYVHLAAR